MTRGKKETQFAMFLVSLCSGFVMVISLSTTFDGQSEWIRWWSTPTMFLMFNGTVQAILSLSPSLFFLSSSSSVRKTLPKTVRFVSLFPSLQTTSLFLLFPLLFDSTKNSFFFVKTLLFYPFSPSVFRFFFCSSFLSTVVVVVVV